MCRVDLKVPPGSGLTPAKWQRLMQPMMTQILYHALAAECMWVLTHTKTSSVQKSCSVYWPVADSLEGGGEEGKTFCCHSKLGSSRS